MKLVRQTPEELILMHRPYWLCLALSALSVVALVVGLWHGIQGDWMKTGVGLLMGVTLAGPAVWLGAERIIVTFDTQTDTCAIDTRQLRGVMHESYQLKLVERAEVQTHKGFGQGDAHRVALLLSPGRAEDSRPLTHGYTGGRQAKDLVARINGWLEQARTVPDA